MKKFISDCVPSIAVGPNPHGGLMEDLKSHDGLIEAAAN